MGTHPIFESDFDCRALEALFERSSLNAFVDSARIGPTEPRRQVQTRHLPAYYPIAARVRRFCRCRGIAQSCSSIDLRHERAKAEDYLQGMPRENTRQSPPVH